MTGCTGCMNVVYQHNRCCDIALDFSRTEAPCQGDNIHCVSEGDPRWPCSGTQGRIRVIFIFDPLQCSEMYQLVLFHFLICF